MADGVDVITFVTVETDPSLPVVALSCVTVAGATCALLDVGIDESAEVELSLSSIGR